MATINNIPNAGGPAAGRPIINANFTAINNQVEAQQTSLSSKANLASPALTGTPTAPTASPGTNTTQIATTAFVLANASGGTGTVTNVSVVPANGVSGSVANATTTPAITLTLGAINPSSVNGVTHSGSGSVSNSGTSSLSGFTGSGSSSGTNTGDQTSVTGNAGTATALQTARNINGTSFNGTADVTVTAAAGTLTGGTLASGVTSSSLTSFGTSPALTGTPTAPTATGGTNTTQIATTAFVQSAVAGGGGGNVSNSGTPVSGQAAEWTSANNIQGVAVTGTGSYVKSASPTLTAPALGTPSAIVLTNATGLPVSTGVSGLGSGVATSLATNVGTAGSIIVNGGSIGTPSGGVATNITGLPLSTGVTGDLPFANLTPASAASKLLGRGDAGAGDYQEITLGSGLSMTGTTLSASGGGGGSSDMLSTLTGAEISITGATTATISRMHVCTGTSADYTVTLPAASGNTGKFIGFRMSPSLTKIVTLDGNSSETIDGATTRLMWSQETAILLCDGSNWFKVAGRSNSMGVRAHFSTGSVSQATYAANSSNTINLTVADFDPAGLFSSGTSSIVIKRAGMYSAIAYFSAGENYVGYFEGYVLVNAGSTGGASILPAVNVGGSTNLVSGVHSAIISLAAGDSCKIGCYTSASGTSRPVNGYEPALSLQEVPAW